MLCRNMEEIVKSFANFFVFLDNVKKKNYPNNPKPILQLKYISKWVTILLIRVDILAGSGGLNGENLKRKWTRSTIFIHPFLCPSIYS